MRLLFQCLSNNNSEAKPNSQIQSNVDEKKKEEEDGKERCDMT